jgi:hypothetical protein
MDANTSGTHAMMISPDEHAYAKWINPNHQGIRNLRTHSLLRLKTPSKYINKSRKFGKADDPAVRDIPDMRDTNNIRQVVFAFTYDGDVMDDYHFISCTIFKRF